jgi:hypothetical protein
LGKSHEKLAVVVEEALVEAPGPLGGVPGLLDAVLAALGGLTCTLTGEGVQASSIAARTTARPRVHEV